MRFEKNSYVKRMNEVRPYVTLDGSLVYEIINPAKSPVRSVSVATAIVKPGSSTELHEHIDLMKFTL